MNWTLIHKYLSGECSPKEMQKVNDWLSADRKNQLFMESLKKIWDVELQDEIEIDGKAAWDLFRHKLSGKDENISSESVYKKKDQARESIYSDSYPHKKYTHTIAICVSAAAVILIAVLLYNFMPQFGLTGNESLVKQTNMQQVRTEQGQHAKFRLSDGTLVQLNADSKISITRDFGDSTRSIYLMGEAYFQVTHNPEIPFIVRSGDSYTKVLGTKFGVKAYPADNNIEVAVEEGKVELGSSASYGRMEKYITRNQIGSFSKTGKVTVSSVEEIQEFLGWKDGWLIFNGTPFREVKPQLERWYDIKIVVADTLSLYPQKLTASFKDEPVTEVINALSLSLDLNYKREGRVISFNSN